LRHFQLFKPREEITRPHYHHAVGGLAVVCFHKCHVLLTNWQFWLGLTLGFPVEHLIWEKLWPFKLLTQWWGL
jgi:hypothetical protein